MAGNSIGTVFRLTTFGESHGAYIGGVIDGCPSGLEIDMDFIQNEIARRRPGFSSFNSARKEEDKLRLISGIFEQKTTGAPIAFLIANSDAIPADYEHLADAFRPSHADYTYHKKYGIRDYRGGGRSSARETSVRVAAGAIAKLLLRTIQIEIIGFVSGIGPYHCHSDLVKINAAAVRKSPVCCPDADLSAEMVAYLERLRHEGDTTGGVITCVVRGVPVGWGEPVFDKLQADLAKAMLSINAAKGFEYGSGFAGSEMKGSLHNDGFVRDSADKTRLRTITNFSGGIQGGISNGEDIYFRVAFKPVSTLMRPQATVNKHGEQVILHPAGRHDVCVAPRAVPVVEAMTALTLADHYLRGLSAQLPFRG